jgi:long-chain acyl-CoA synthetase
MTDPNLASLLRRQALRLGPRPAIRYKRHGLYCDYPWDRYRADVRAAAASLAAAGIAPGDRVGLLSENRREWLVADLAILTAAAVTVSPHAPLTAPQVQFQLHHSGARWLFVSTPQQLQKVREVRDSLPELQGIVVFEPEAVRSASEWGLAGVTSWEAFLHQGRRVLTDLGPELDRRERDLGPDDLAGILYTSGTTGNPKGVMLTHHNILSNVQACVSLAPYRPTDVILNWLPLTHIYARTVDHYLSLLAGVSLALAESAETLVANLGEVQPTHLSSVPRFYEKLLTALATDDPEETGRRLRGVFGPRLDWAGSGGAPLPLPVAKAYQQAGILLFQGYGLTESSPVISFNTREHNKLGTVGRPIPGVEVKIAPDGEVLTRGPHVMKGYWKNPRATAEAIRDGWLHTGDLGNLDEDGYLSITGRKKELLVLSNGKKVLPSEIEGLLQADPCIDQVMVCGEGKPYLTALIVPHWDNVQQALGSGPVRAGSVSDGPLPDDAVEELLRRRVEAALAGVSSAERVKQFVVLPRPFSVEADEMTVSLKLRREVILRHNEEQLESLYRRQRGAGQLEDLG